MGAAEQAKTSDLEGRSVEARRRLDEWTRDVVRWHFDPATGCPFWLDFADRLDWNPAEEIQGFDDLERFGLFRDDWLRGGPVRRWVPRGLDDRPLYVFETGGSTGVPKSRINADDFRIDYSMFSETISDDGFPRGSNWLMLGPSGPRRLRLAIEHLAQVRGGICFCIDMDPRWVVRLIGKGQFDVLEDYKDHVIQQALTLLKAHDDIQCMFTTPKLLEALCEKVSLRQVGIRGVFCGGTEMTRQFHRFAREELLEGAEFAPTYGNTLMGLACHKPFDPADDYRIIYHAPQPRAVLQVVDPDRPERVVDYGQRGRVKLTTLTKEFFMPALLERDEAIRTPPIPKYPWDGVADVRPFRSEETRVVVGVY
jgi:phenylacetate-coenzyme A ligase PaaK-like adenylate-forming protein